MWTKNRDNIHIYDNEKVGGKTIRDQFKAKKCYKTKLKPTIKLNDQTTNFAKLIPFPCV